MDIFGAGSASSDEISKDTPYAREQEANLKRLQDRATGKTRSISSVTSQQLGQDAGSNLVSGLKGASGLSSALKSRIAAREGAKLSGGVAKAGVLGEVKERVGYENSLLDGTNKLTMSTQAQQQARSKAVSDEQDRRQKFIGAIASGGSNSMLG